MQALDSSSTKLASRLLLLLIKQCLAVKTSERLTPATCLKRLDTVLRIQQKASYSKRPSINGTATKVPDLPQRRSSWSGSQLNNASQQDHPRPVTYVEDSKLVSPQQDSDSNGNEDSHTSDPQPQQDSGGGDGTDRNGDGDEDNLLNGP